MPPQPPTVHLEIDSRVENIDLVQVVVKESLRRLSLSEKRSYEIGMAVREAVANAVRHGNLEDPEKSVAVEFRVEGDEVVIEVRDQGEGFDPESVRDPVADANLLRPNGRGILFMRNFMDSIDYEVHADGGTVVTMRKRIGAEHSAEEERQ